MSSLSTQRRTHPFYIIFDIFSRYQSIKHYKPDSTDVLHPVFY